MQFRTAQLKNKQHLALFCVAFAVLFLYISFIWFFFLRTNVSVFALKMKTCLITEKSTANARFHLTYVIRTKS